MTWTEPAFEALADLVRARTGLVFMPDRRPGVETGIRRAMARAGSSLRSVIRIAVRTRIGASVPMRRNSAPPRSPRTATTVDAAPTSTASAR